VKTQVGTPRFHCLVSTCGRRGAVLYGGGIFACRQCHGLIYESQREAPHGRALSRAQAIRMRLGGSGGMAEDFPERPKGMHWQTYSQLLAKAEQAEMQSWPPVALRMILNDH
jgi:hypothetical protein